MLNCKLKDSEVFWGSTQYGNIIQEVLLYLFEKKYTFAMEHELKLLLNVLDVNLARLQMTLVFITVILVVAIVEIIQRHKSMCKDLWAKWRETSRNEWTEAVSCCAQTRADGCRRDRVIYQPLNSDIWLSVCLWFSYLMNHSYDLPHTLQVCCWGPEEVQCQIWCNLDTWHIQF